MKEIEDLREKRDTYLMEGYRRLSRFRAYIELAAAFDRAHAAGFGDVAKDMLVAHVGERELLKLIYHPYDNPKAARLTISQWHDQSMVGEFHRPRGRHLVKLTDILNGLNIKGLRLFNSSIHGQTIDDLRGVDIAGCSFWDCYLPDYNELMDHSIMSDRGRATFYQCYFKKTPVSGCVWFELVDCHSVGKRVVMHTPTR